MRTRTNAMPLVLTLLATLGTPARAHEEGVIRLSAKEVRMGSELGLRGEKLPKSATLRLELRGTLETFPVGEVRTNAGGRFEARLALPVEARAGTYTVVAVASDGDVAARAELTIIAAAPAAGAPGLATPGVAKHEGHSAMNTAPMATEGAHPTAAMMKVPVSTTGVERAAVIGIVTLSLAAGLMLLRGSRSGVE